MIHAFGAYELDDELFELRREGVPVPLQRKTFDLLSYLVRSGGRTITRDELLRDVWDGVTVSEHALTQAVLTVRRAIGDDGAEPQLLKTLRGRGYRFVGSVVTRERAGQAVDPGALPHVGRDAALEQISSALDHAASGRGRLVMVFGEQGIGKTRLLEELGRHAPGVRSVTGHCFDGEGAPPLWPWLQIHRRLREPPSSDRTRSGVLDVDLESAPARFRFGDRLLGRIRDEAREAPLVVVLEDAHWIDDASLDLVRLLGPDLASSRILLVLTARASTPRLMGAVARLPSTTVIELERLRRADVAVLIASVTGRPADDAVVTRIFEKTAGNPSSFVRIADVLRAVVPHAPGTSALLASNVVKSALAEQVENLRAELRRALGFASVFGVTFSLGPLALALEIDRESLVVALDEAAAHRVVASSSDGKYRFTQPLVRDALYRALPEGERLRLHATAARALRTFYGADAEAHAAEIAPHLVEAAILGDAAAAVRQSLAALEAALARGDRRAAERFLALARRGLEHARDGELAAAVERAAVRLAR